MKWREFKAALEEEGVKDDDELVYIDVHGGEGIAVERNHDDAYFKVWSI
jgi:hypothetical protein